jgi:hypothetical protein
VSANALTRVERHQILAVLDGPEFVDAAPAQVYATLLDKGVYIGSIATTYRILREHRQVRERRRPARHPARRRPELVADAPRPVFSWDITTLAGPAEGSYFDAYDDRHLLPVHRRRPRTRSRNGAPRRIDDA